MDTDTSIAMIEHFACTLELMLHLLLCLSRLGCQAHMWLLLVGSAFIQTQSVRCILYASCECMAYETDSSGAHPRCMFGHMHVAGIGNSLDTC